MVAITRFNSRIHMLSACVQTPPSPYFEAGTTELGNRNCLAEFINFDGIHITT